MRLRYPGICRLCGTSIPAGTQAVYESETKAVRCLECFAQAEKPTRPPDPELPPEDLPSGEPPPARSGVAGASARREYERRKARDEQRLREKWGRLGGLAVALSDERQSTKAWETGAIGEERLGARLDSLAGHGIVALHDRRVPGSKANIDHIVITPKGIWVIDAKRYKGRPELKVEGGLLRPRTETLVVGRRDCTKLVDGVLNQIEVLRPHVPDVAVTGALCFIEADWPLIGGFFSTRGIHVISPKRLAKLLTRETAGGVNVAWVRDAVTKVFKPA